MLSYPGWLAGPFIHGIIMSNNHRWSTAIDCEPDENKWHDDRWDLKASFNYLGPLGGRKTQNSDLQINWLKWRTCQQTNANLHIQQTIGIH